MKMQTLAILFAVLTAGCQTVTPNYDARFGDAVRDAKRKMTINPDAGKKPDTALGLDGRAAHDTVIRYHDSFKEPPPAVNVINIGGAIGSQSGGR
ncbi:MULTISPECIES: hypothetical protein [unclassified Variovorax]|uniref:hypothetical protein n=1 Tax=unclassified Variovorax TaxID=663243 RepID=UPI00076BEEED|nr:MULTISPECIES: hypothetical protein [unclassified Variovorax]KWT93433.1 putative lipoprotein [Variovorax sp. WDL1]PNG46791.1 hypothetical protein CHC06_07134 [Variovorax sp. B2]PNG48557.1 hypothetical protein CHC07_07733 [Variovorax sp. B4]VTV14600.1 hypothetical protein WDL1CHR_05108 [Variovorax sp. WDL1]